MSTAALLFEQPYRGDVWRLEVASHGGRTFLNWRRWYWDGDTLRPTREGVTIPLERLPELHAALAAYLAGRGWQGLKPAGRPYRTGGGWRRSPPNSLNLKLAKGARNAAARPVVPRL